MALSKKNGKLYAQVYAGIVDGKRQYIFGKKGYSKKSDAQLEEIDLKKNVLEIDHKVYEKESFVYIAETWLSIRKSEVAYRTYDTSKYYFEHYIKPYFKNYAIADISTLDIRKYISSLDYSPETVCKIITTLNLIFNFAIDTRCVRFTPMVNIKNPKITISKKETWNESEIYDFLNCEEVKNSTAYTAFMILFTTGMRPGEVCGLRWCDLKNDHFTPTIGIDKKRQITNLKNEYAHSNVYISDTLQHYLKKLRLAHKSLYFECGEQLTMTSYINALPPDFRPMTPDYLRKAFDRLVERNNFRHIILYDAIHSFGTNLMNSGVNSKIVSEAMRHSSV